MPAAYIAPGVSFAMVLKNLHVTWRNRMGLSSDFPHPRLSQHYRLKTNFLTQLSKTPSPSAKAPEF
jgi:hypothetical protein